jgi:polyhydroxyalkanoate synthesis regulator protein
MLHTVPSSAAQSKQKAMASPRDPVSIKRYAERRLYAPVEARYLGFDDLDAMLCAGEAFIVHDARSGADVTGAVIEQVKGDQARHG